MTMFSKLPCLDRDQIQKYHFVKYSSTPISKKNDHLAMDNKKTVHNSLQNPFTWLLTDLICEIISRTSPLDASRSSVISKEFKSAADSNTVWEKFLPKEILSSSPVVYGTNKDFYLSLCNSTVLLDGGKLSLSIVKKSGKKCYMIGARELIISWGDCPAYWGWASHPDSRFVEVAYLNCVCWLDIRGKIKKQMLSRNTTYGAYFVFKLANNVYGLEAAYSVVKLINQEADCDAEKRATLVHLHKGQPMYRSPPQRQTGRLPVRRDDGWMEIEMGDFYNDSGDDGEEVEARLMEIWRGNGKRGLIVEGIEFRPKTPCQSHKGY